MSEPAVCTECGKRPPITKDGRHLCRACLLAAIRRANPIRQTRYRDRDERQAMSGESDPWGELGVRLLEDAGND
jgi:hypothetical protein